MLWEVAKVWLCGFKGVVCVVARLLLCVRMLWKVARVWLCSFKYVVCGCQGVAK